MLLRPNKYRNLFDLLTSLSQLINFIIMVLSYECVIFVRRRNEMSNMIGNVIFASKKDVKINKFFSSELDFVECWMN